MSFVLCLECRRHVKVGSACPFCGSLRRARATSGRAPRRWLLAAGVATASGASACPVYGAPTPYNDDGGPSSSVSTSSSTTSGGLDPGPCGLGCDLDVPECFAAVCNDGSHGGTIGECLLVPEPGGPCDDGIECTANDTCDDEGFCAGESSCGGGGMGGSPDAGGSGGR